MELNEASHGGVQELSVDYDINSAADYNFSGRRAGKWGVGNPPTDIDKMSITHFNN